MLGNRSGGLTEADTHNEPKDLRTASAFLRGGAGYCTVNVTVAVCDCDTVASASL